jgi:hypothetical protein
VKQYRFVVAIPGHEKGDVVPEDFTWCGTNSSGVEYFRKPHHFPEILEPIPDPVERVTSWLTEMWVRTTTSYVKDWAVNIAPKLLAAGLDPDKLEGVK